MPRFMVEWVERRADMTCCPPGNKRLLRAALDEIAFGGAVVRDWSLVPSGEYTVGSNDVDANPGDAEGPLRAVRLAEFLIAATVVTNREFAEFISATGYKTEAEQLGWSFVFHNLVAPKAASKVRKWPAEAPWWHVVEGACWRWPGGRGSHIGGKENHPVVHVSWNDAVAYCQWSGTRLPTEIEWEVAARGGLANARYPWGDELRPGGRHMCNIWQGEFPTRDDAEDGFHGTCAVRSFPANGYGLFEVAGKVWEWCDDWWIGLNRHPSETPPGAVQANSAKVMRGGSFLCHESYCNRYRVAARTSNPPDSAASNIGFRVVKV